ncbi:unnamed protein product [Acanthoscelides obtectus]|uniref:PHD-type domain-containing protein n=1 Tax=Acanthoscelides obtectus TaxID=200917 RepID=A0A9P0PR48_ACAOB|nr:unnamed protein product [Acanthoscelides obtectus]CAK1632211.1 Transcription initiation factor TFIID subunit 3 [Acanthoscelides obtectus]
MAFHQFYTIRDYANEFGQTEANLDHLAFAFQEMGINVAELEEYTTFVNFAPPATPTPKFPLPKEDNLNFLKPGSKEVVTRPVHIPEHLPPMFPLLEGAENEEEKVEIKQEVESEEVKENNSLDFKKPAAISPEFRRPKREDEGGRPTREISSVMMTTSGFLSPAREGKLPEPKAPVPPPPTEPPPLIMTTPIEPVLKKKVEKRKEKVGKELLKPLSQDEKVMKKTPTMKDLVKMKQKMTSGLPNIPPNLAIPPLTSIAPHPPLQQLTPQEPKLNLIPNAQKMISEKFDKALAAAKAKTEKLNTTITPIPNNIPPLPSSITIQQVEKLFNQPDKKKVNIFKKISNVKDGKTKKDSRSSTPSLMMDDHADIVNKISLSSDITIEPIHSAPPLRRSPEKYGIFDDDLPIGIPSTPRTPDIMTHIGPTMQKEKRKRKDTKKVKRVKKSHNFMPGTEIIDLVAGMGRPKTPDAHLPMGPRGGLGLPHMPSHLPFPLLPNFAGPGLIPKMNTPMFPFSHLGTFGKNPYFPSVPPFHSMPQQVEPVSLVSPKAKDAIEIKPVEVVQKPNPAPKPVQPTHQPAPMEVAPPPNVTPPSVTTIKEEPLHLSEEVKDKKPKEHKKDKEKKIKKKNKKDKLKDKSEKKKLKDAKKVEAKEKVKKDKKIKKKEKLTKELENPIPKMILKVNSPSPRPETPESIKKLNIKPIVKRDEVLPPEGRHREPSPASGLAKISALVTGPPKPKTTVSPVVTPVPDKAASVPLEPPPQATVPPPRLPSKPKTQATPKPPKAPKPPKKTEQTFKKIDEDGNEVWICPACNQQDDGRPMIGCDGCDAWYHWVCVGIQVPPDENENWYCKPCLCKKNEDLQSDKKRKRKKKEKKDH